MILTDIKPDNILVNWTHDEVGTKTITDVALGDFDITYKCETGAMIQSTHAVGNAMWRSPEGQTGRGMCKASDIYSFGLVVSYSTLFSMIKRTDAGRPRSAYTPSGLEKSYSSMTTRISLSMASPLNKQFLRATLRTLDQRTRAFSNTLTARYGQRRFNQRRKWRKRRCKSNQ